MPAVVGQTAAWAAAGAMSALHRNLHQGFATRERDNGRIREHQSAKAEGHERKIFARGPSRFPTVRVRPMPGNDAATRKIIWPGRPFEVTILRCILTFEAPDD
jgi:hypothetical protein